MKEANIVLMFRDGRRIFFKTEQELEEFLKTLPLPVFEGPSFRVSYF